MSKCRCTDQREALVKILGEIEQHGQEIKQSNCYYLSGVVKGKARAAKLLIKSCLKCKCKCKRKENCE